ncbi:caspase family protein [Micromonospora sp. NPDC053740]|uniref:caspase family protein n=1 Tax=Micromonospora sp. NPDC053740 TaxID=3155173 RepID=UPI0034326A2B
MNTVYALIVGIDSYLAVSPLRGCRRDAAAMLGALRVRTHGSSTLSELELYDRKATRAAIIDGLRHHLTLAGPGDTALFYFAGHGSTSPVPPELWHLESMAMSQTLVCADSRHDGVPDLWDKELSVLLDQVAENGCHVAVVLDSCHSDGATRGSDPLVRNRSVPPGPAPRAETLLPELSAGYDNLPERTRHIALAACRSTEYAREMPDAEGVPRGVFTVALLRALAELGPAATYREVLGDAQCAVEDRVLHQRPQLSGAPRLADQPFLGGDVTTPASAMVMRHVRDAWEIDVGHCHGLPSADGGELRVGVSGSRPVRLAEVVSVHAERSTVQPVGWVPDATRQYPVVVTDLPQPLATADISYDRASSDTAGAITELLRASPFVRMADPLSAVRADLSVRVAGPGLVMVCTSEGDRVADDITGVPADCARRTVATLEHIARWREVKALSNPRSALAGAVRIQVVEALPGEKTAPLARAALRPDDEGVIRLAYHSARPPTVFLRLRNTSEQPLYCVLLDLTDSYRIHAGLFPGAFVAPGHSGAALEGRPVQMRLPAGVAAAPGASVRDWIKLIVAEEEFSCRPFELGRLDARVPATERGPVGLGGILDRLGRIAVHRDAGSAEPHAAYDWSTAMVRIRTSVDD